MHFFTNTASFKLTMYNYYYICYVHISVLELQ